MNQGQGGWPMTVFLTPEQEPFFAGTYFPPEDRYGRPGLPVAARSASPSVWETDRGPHARAGRTSSSSTCARTRRRRPACRSATAGAATARRRSSRADFDARCGGFGRAPKFPPVGRRCSLLLRVHRRIGDARRAARWSRKTLDEMARGGMYDQVGGGFHRYSVDERWLVPHFEKMLYDNALLARAYLEGYQATRRAVLRARGRARSSTTCCAR